MKCDEKWSHTACRRMWKQLVPQDVEGLGDEIKWEDEFEEQQAPPPLFRHQSYQGPNFIPLVPPPYQSPTTSEQDQRDGPLH